ncbi:tyrosine-protein phosphatase [Enterococcus hulanensis]|uniref:tyrosine-protein phosphatase n=1 Tax=Enterococcus hulanensis TaxID=2559929 RepID=UPI0010F7B93A|nr:tyrosine-protein phosphatase [Enterococcus hulanensis]
MNVKKVVLSCVAASMIILLGGYSVSKAAEKSSEPKTALSSEKNTSKKIVMVGAANTRDLGGIVTKDGASIKKNKLIRSGELADLVPLDKERLVNDFKLTNIVDLRTDSEVASKPDPEIENVKNFHYGVMKDSGVTASQEDFYKNLDKVNGVEYMEKINQELVTDPTARENYKKFFDVLLTSENGSTLWHCTAGKDRAGFATMLVLSALGVDKKSIFEDYLLSNKYRKSENEKSIEQVKEATNDNKEAVENITAMMEVRKSYLQTAYDTMEKEYGGVNGYLKKGLGLTNKDISNLKAIYLTKN